MKFAVVKNMQKIGTLCFHFNNFWLGEKQLLRIVLKGETKLFFRRDAKKLVIKQCFTFILL